MPVVPLLALLLLAGPVYAKTGQACAPGRFLVVGEPITTGAAQSGARAIVVGKPVGLPGLCEAASKSLVRRAGRKAMRVAATWRRCAGFRGRLRFTGKVVDGCNRLVGTLRARKYKRRVTALRSRCGDGVVDAPANEQCEPPATAGCDVACRSVSPPGAPPRVALRAAPAAGVVPLATTFEAIADDPEGNPLTYRWTFGDGTEADGGATIAHTYAQPGGYRCTVVVSDGGNRTSAAVLIDAGSAGSTTAIGPAGGGVSLGRLRLEVPAGLLPQAVDVGVLEVPSLAAQGAATLDPARFRPIGPAYRLDVPLRTADPLDLALSFADAEIPAGFPGQHLGVLWRVEPVTEAPAPDGLAVVFVPAAATVEPATHTVRTEVAGSVVVQVVAMAAPLDVRRRPAARAAVPRADPQPPLVIVSFLEMPPDPSAYSDAVRAAVTNAFDALVVQRGFPRPGSTLTVTVTPLAATNAAVSAKMPQLMLVDPDRVPIADLPTTIAHEYFHSIQFWSSNQQSVHDANRWFLEGGAEWARDEVVDGVAGAYLAPAGKRFQTPLNLPTALGIPAAYETVAFWKWLEAAAPGMMRAIVDDHRARTRIHVSPTVDILSTVDARYLDGLLALHPAIDFLDFAFAALWKKDYDPNETGAGDLWDAARLGPEKQVPADLQDVVELKQGAPGDGATNPLTVPYILGAHLTADTQQLVSLDGSLAGTLHLRFPGRTDHRVGVAVLAPLSGREVLLHDLSVERTVEMGFSPGEQVVVIETDGDWQAAGGGPHAGSYDAWVEPCGGPAGGAVVEVDSTAALRAALLAAQPGDTVRLAAGTYYPPATEWPFWHVTTITGIAMVPPGVTLAGAGASKTVVVGQGAGSDLYLKDGATLRDLTLRFAGDGQGIWAGGAEDEDAPTRRVWLCNMAAYYSHRHWYPGALFSAIEFQPVYNGTYSFEMHGCTVDCSGSTMRSIGIELWPSGPTGASIHVAARIRGSTVTGCETGLEYMESTGQSVDMDVECSGFLDNKDDNVIRYECSTNPCTWVEECPG